MDILLILCFILGYLAIALEHSIQINKAASALLTGVLCWVIFTFYQHDKEEVLHELTFHLGEISGILFFLLGAMTIVELIDAHDGFQVITRRIKTQNRRALFWIIGLVSFFLSAVLDNLTTTIVMVSLVRKLVQDREDRLYFAGLIVIAANSGGAWSPIGDVTTTMLWVGGQISAGNIMLKTFVASLVSLIVPLLMLSSWRKGRVSTPEQRDQEEQSQASVAESYTVFYLGVSALLFVPVFKALTGLPPFMGMLFSLGVMWIFTEVINRKRNESDKNYLSVLYALRKIDTPSVLFFLGILISVGALQQAGLLKQLALSLNAMIGSESLIVVAIGLLSSVVDNVPLVAAAQGMYTLNQFPQDHTFWAYLAYAAGTGGSCLIIGSAAGVAAMGMEDISFGWYLRRISGLALAGYLAGALVFWLEHY